MADRDLSDLRRALEAAVASAIDTETVYEEPGPGALRVVSIATRDPSGCEQAWVVDVNVVDHGRLASALSGVEAAAWNADFDAQVIERDLIDPAREQGLDVTPVRWWDAQLADALIHQGMSGFGFYHGLAWAAEWYLGVIAEGKGTVQLSYRADGELTDEQLAYAAADAVETLWVADEVRRRIDGAGLTRVCDLEQRARPFLDHMQRAGLPVDWEGWEAQLREMSTRRDATIGRLAELTGGGQGSLFSEHLEPWWNPGSERDTKEVLNRHAPDRVRSWCESELGEARLLEPTDPIPASVLEGIGGELCEALLEYRDLTKVLSTYGESIRDHIGEDGRLHPEYLQVVGTNTGRLASRNPNAQNLSPRMKPFLRPSDPDRVFVYSDLSQAELRFVAQVSGDVGLRDAFAAGVDVHVATAERMFGVDMTRLRDDEPARFDELRAKSKRINFGIVYGQRGGGLARALSQSGVETSRDEGRELLDAYLGAYPHVATWVDERDRFIDRLVEAPSAMDWQATLDLHRMWGPIQANRRAFRDEHRRWPSVEEVTAQLGSYELDHVAWTMSFNATVVLDTAGIPFGFASFTPAGRRQQFTIHTESVLGSAAATVVNSPKPGPSAVRDAVTRRHGTAFTDRGAPLPKPRVKKLLEDRSLRRAIIDEVQTTMGDDALATLLDGALSSRVARMANAYRNAPIQGGVADVMLDAYGRLHERLADHPSAVGVQTVHDSVVIECDRCDAAEVARLVKTTMEDAMRAWCPDIAALADTDIRTSLSDADVECSLQ